MYIDPHSVLSPRSLIQAVDVLYDTGPVQESWSVALVRFHNGDEAIGFRWNGDENSPIGNPQSHGKPTWSIVPEPLGRAMRETAEELSSQAEGGLLEGYRAMASDAEREGEAQEWSEGLIEDGAGQAR